MRIKLTERNMLISLIVVSSVLLCLRACVSTSFVYLLLGFGFIAFVFCPLRVCLPLLCFLLPFGAIFKLGVGQISLFTILFFLYILRVLLKTGRLNRMFLLSMLFFAGYCLIFSGTGRIITIVTMVSGFAMVHEVCESEEYNFEEVLYSFCAGIIISSVLGLFADSLPLIKSFVGGVFQRVGVGEYVERFCGLNVNPNYYTMDISIALGCLVSQMCSSKPKWFQMILFAVLSVFGLMSISKSFLLIWVVLLVILLMFGLRNGGTSFLKLLGVFVVTGCFIYFFAQESIETYIYRLSNSSSDDLSSVTTGRSDIWIEYAQLIISGEKVLFFGKGLGQIIEGTATHSTYVELFYYLGLVGASLYFFAMRASIKLKNLPSNVLYYIPLLILLIRFVAIGMLIQDSLWYYIAIICLLLKKYGAVYAGRSTKMQTHKYVGES